MWITNYILFIGCVLYHSTLVTCWLTRPKQAPVLHTINCITASAAFGKRVIPLCGNQGPQKRANNRDVSTLLDSLIASLRHPDRFDEDILSKNPTSDFDVSKRDSGQSTGLYDVLATYMERRDEEERPRLALDYDVEQETQYPGDGLPFDYPTSGAKRLMNDMLDSYLSRYPRIYRRKRSVTSRR